MLRAADGTFLYPAHSYILFAETHEDKELRVELVAPEQNRREGMAIAVTIHDVPQPLDVDPNRQDLERKTFVFSQLTRLKNADLLGMVSADTSDTRMGVIDGALLANAFDFDTKGFRNVEESGKLQPSGGLFGTSHEFARYLLRRPSLKLVDLDRAFQATLNNGDAWANLMREKNRKMFINSHWESNGFLDRPSDKYIGFLFYEGPVRSFEGSIAWTRGLFGIDRSNDILAIKAIDTPWFGFWGVGQGKRDPPTLSRNPVHTSDVEPLDFVGDVENLLLQRPDVTPHQNRSPKSGELPGARGQSENHVVKPKPVLTVSPSRITRRAGDNGASSSNSDATPPTPSGIRRSISVFTDITEIDGYQAPRNGSIYYPSHSWILFGETRSSDGKTVDPPLRVELVAPVLGAQHQGLAISVTELSRGELDVEAFDRARPPKTSRKLPFTLSVVTTLTNAQIFDSSLSSNNGGKFSLIESIWINNMIAHDIPEISAPKGRNPYVPYIFGNSNDFALAVGGDFLWHPDYESQLLSLEERLYPGQLWAHKTRNQNRGHFSTEYPRQIPDLFYEITAKEEGGASTKRLFTLDATSKRIKPYEVAAGWEGFAAPGNQLRGPAPRLSRNPALTSDVGPFEPKPMAPKVSKSPPPPQTGDDPVPQPPGPAVLGVDQPAPHVPIQTSPSISVFPKAEPGSDSPVPVPPNPNTFRPDGRPPRGKVTPLRSPFANANKPTAPGFDPTKEPPPNLPGNPQPPANLWDDSPVPQPRRSDANSRATSRTFSGSWPSTQGSSKPSSEMSPSPPPSSCIQFWWCGAAKRDLGRSTARRRWLWG